MLSRYVEFANSISSIYRYIQKIEKNAMAKYGLKGSHAQCLIAMSQYPKGITAVGLCECCDKDKAAISRTVAELEKLGYIVRRGDGDNMYRAALLLTDTGKTLADELTLVAVTAVKKADEGLDERSRAVFYKTLGLFANNLDKITKEGL